MTDFEVDPNVLFAVIAALALALALSMTACGYESGFNRGHFQQHETPVTK